MAVVTKSLSKDSLAVGSVILSLSVKLFFVGVVFSLAFVIHSVLLKEAKFLKKESVQGISAVLEKVPSVIDRERQDYSQFLRQIQSRDIFTAVVVEKGVSASGAQLDKIKKIIEGLRLVGIKSGAVSKVIIEDTGAGKTSYLKEGDSFSEGIVVEAIGKDSVILNGGGESFELYL
ncbi:MAG: hypothetical protein ABIH71_05190 [Candidatus Omnitrophota bacterium]|nr:general secretion pathway protein GspB [Candidatus Omnitrophota bacterium]